MEQFDVRGANLALVTDAQLCEAYGEREIRLPEIKAEILKRTLFDAEEMALIDAKTARVGMTECALFAALPKHAASIKFSKDFPGDAGAKSVSYECSKEVKLPFCPVTTFEIRSGHIQGILLEQ
jgi:hypothetical protein